MASSYLDTLEQRASSKPATFCTVLTEHRERDTTVREFQSRTNTTRYTLGRP